MQRHVILMPNWIGDYLIALAVVLRREKKEQLTLLVPSYLEDLTKKLVEIPVMAYARKTGEQYKETLSTIRANHFDRITLLPLSFSSALLAFRSRIRQRAGLKTECRGFLLSDRLPSKLRTKRTHLISEYATVLETAPWAPEQWEGFEISGEFVTRYANTVVMCPGAKYGPAKQWPHFARLAEKIGERIVVVGTAEDRAEGEKIKASAPQRVENLCGRTSLVEVMSIIAAAKVVISNDSGLMHMAGFLGTPVLALFGSTSPVWTRPLGKKTTVIQNNQPCAPCFKRTCRYGHYKCLREIKVDDVLHYTSEM